MDKQLYDLKIDPELEASIYPLTEEEFEGLKTNILKNGCTDPLMVWNGFIADGHNRYRICKENNIPFAIEEVQCCETKEDVLLWMFERALDRRNLSDYTRTVLALRKESLLAERAAKRMKAGKKIDPTTNSSEGSKGETREKIAKLAGKGTEYVSRVKKLEANADQETRKKLHRGEVTVNKAYADLFGSKGKDISAQQEKAQPAPKVQPQSQAQPVQVNGEVLNGMADNEGFVHHTAAVTFTNPDEAQEAVRAEMETVLSSFRMGIEDCLDRLNQESATKEFLAELLSMIKSESKSAVIYVTRFMKGEISNE